MKCCSDVSSTGDCSPVWPNSDLLPPPDEQKKEKKKKKKIPGPRMENKEGEKTGQVLLIVCVYSPHHSIWFYFIEIFLFIDLTNAMFLTLFFFFFFFSTLGWLWYRCFWLLDKNYIWQCFLFFTHFLLTLSIWVISIREVVQSWFLKTFNVFTNFWVLVYYQFTFFFSLQILRMVCICFPHFLLTLQPALSHWEFLAPMCPWLRIVFSVDLAQIHCLLDEKKKKNLAPWGEKIRWRKPGQNLLIVCTNVCKMIIVPFLQILDARRIDVFCKLVSSPFGLSG